MEIDKETELGPPLKAWLQAHGYTVHAEVKNCDMAARKGDDLILVEMKRAITMDLLVQVVKRQEMAESVYAAVPVPPRRDKAWRDKARLVRRLGAGLLVIHLYNRAPVVEAVFHPTDEVGVRKRSKTKAVITEMNGRILDRNRGGSSGGALFTAYRQQAIQVAIILERLGQASPKSIRDAGGSIKTGAILRDNYYGWFGRHARGIYSLTQQGLDGLKRYADVVAALNPETNGASTGK